MKKLFQSVSMAKFVIFFAFLFLQFFAFGAIKQAYALCNYSITRFDTGSVKQITSKDSVTFYGTVEMKEEASTPQETTDCTKSYHTIYISSNDLSTSGVGILNVQVLRSGNPGLFVKKSGSTNIYTYSFTKAVNMSSYPASQFASKSSIKFSLNAAGSVRGASAKADWDVDVLSSGGNTNPNLAGGLAGISISFSPDKQVYSKDETVQVKAFLPTVEYNKIPNTVSRIKMETYIGGQKVGSYDFNKVDLVANSTANKQQTVQIKTPPFVDGANNIEVKFLDIGGSILLGSGTGRISVQGLGVATLPPPTPGGGAGGGVTPGGTTDPTTPTTDCTGDKPDPNRCLYNPLPESNLTKMFLLLARGFLAIMGIWGVMFIIVGGFRLITANGNEEQITAAKKSITWAIIGVVVAIMSFSIIAIVQNFLPVNIQTIEIEKK